MIIVLRWDVVCAKTRSLRAVATTALVRFEDYEIPNFISNLASCQRLRGRLVPTCFEAVPSRNNIAREGSEAAQSLSLVSLPTKENPTQGRDGFCSLS